MKLKVSFAVSFWVCCLFASVCVAGQNTINHKNFYQLTGDLLNTKMLVLTYDIDKCCYLYKEAFKFEVKDSEAVIGSVLLPEGQKHKDDYFGDVEIYREQVKITLAINYSRVLANPGSLIVKARHQGCSDEGVCFLPADNLLDFAFFPEFK